MKSEKQKSNKGLIIALITVGSLFLLLLGFLIYIYFSQNDTLTIFSIEDVDPSIANKLSGSIVYSSDRDEDSAYFSPSLELTFSYNKELFSITEATNAVSINPRNYEEYTSAYLKVSQSTDIKGLLLETSYYEDLQVVDENSEDDVGKILFSYSQSSLVNPEKSTTKFISVFYQSITEGKTLYIEVRDFNYTENSEIATALENIIKTSSSDISEIEKDLQAEIQDGTVTLTFDRKLWAITYQTDQSISMSGQGLNKSAFSINLLPVYSLEKVETKDALREQIDDYFELKSEYFKGKDFLFEQIGDYETVTVGSVEFEKVTYKFNYGMEPNTIESYFVGYLPGKELQVNMTSRYTVEGEDSSQYVDKLIEQLQFTDEEIYGALKDNVLGTSNVSINPATVLGQSSTVRIYSTECNDYSFSSSLFGFNLAGNTYTLCSGGFGSGFVIDDIGNVVTNAHVADPNDLIVMMQGIYYNETFLEDLFEDIVTALVMQYGESAIQYLTEEQFADYAISMIYNLNEEGYVTITLNERELYVQGNEPFQFNQVTGELINPTSHYPATLSNSNKINSGIEYFFEEDIKHADIADIAIINVEKEFNVPSIPLMSQGLVTGQPIFVIGYPGLVDKDFIFDTSAIYASTVTQGTISAIKPNSNNTFDLIQIDASVEHGNSGGPIISNEGAVVGIATYGIAPSQSGNYNAGVSAKAVEDFLAQSGITPVANQERELLEDSLLDISKSHYSRAKEKLQNLVDNQDSLGVIINPFIELCDSKIAAGEDKTPVLDLDFSKWQNVIIPIMVLILIIMVIILVMLIVNNKKNKKESNIPQEPITPPQPVPNPVQ